MALARGQTYGAHGPDGVGVFGVTLEELKRTLGVHRDRLHNIGRHL